MTNKKRFGIAVTSAAVLLAVGMTGVAAANLPEETSGEFEYVYDGASAYEKSISGSSEYVCDGESSMEQLRGTLEILKDGDGNLIDEISFREYSTDGGLNWNVFLG